MNASIQQLSLIMKSGCFLAAIGRFLFPIPDLLPYEAEWNGNMTSADGSQSVTITHGAWEGGYVRASVLPLEPWQWGRCLHGKNM